MLHYVLYALEIRLIVSVSVLLDVGFHLFFSRNCVRITLDNVFFMVLDIVMIASLFWIIILQLMAIMLTCCVMSCYSSNNDVHILTWHAILGHIGKDRMNRLAKKDI